CCSRRLRTGLTSKPPLRGAGQFSMSFPALAYRPHIKTAATRRPSVFYVVPALASRPHTKPAATRRPSVFYVVPALAYRPHIKAAATRRPSVFYVVPALAYRPHIKAAATRRPSVFYVVPALAYRPHIKAAATRLVSRWPYALFAEISCPNESFHPAREMEVSARRVVWPEESSPTRESHKKRCRQTSCLARRKQPNQIKPQKTVPPDELSGQKEATKPEQAIKNGVTNKPSTL